MRKRERQRMFTRTLRFRVKREAYPWLNAAAIEVNGVDAPGFSAADFTLDGLRDTLARFATARDTFTH